ncbi:MAG: PspC domain-containing protein [Bacteroidales bacterium]|nr:PspC domain-containing protein [Bacteroidales bacterium]
MQTLFRSKQNKVFAGVCGGLSEYTGIDPLLIRLAFAISAFVGGAGVGIYILLWIFVPTRDTVYNADNIEDATYTEAGDDLHEDDAQSRSHTTEANERANDNRQGRNQYQREGAQREKANGRRCCPPEDFPFTKANKRVANCWATFIGILIFLLGIFWLGNMFGLFHFHFRMLLKLWPALLCFMGLNLIPMHRALRVIFNTILIIAIILLILYVGFCPSANFGTYCFDFFWD